jgi:site-specific DNA-methyltransferase (adenine-specific)
MLQKAMLSSVKDTWGTPKHFFDLLHKVFHFTLDPCTTDENPLQLPCFYTEATDGLSHSWGMHRVFCNPPYGRKQIDWIHKAFEEQQAQTVLLIPSRTDTQIWQDHIFLRADVLFMRGRLKFAGAPASAPFPTALVLINFEAYTDKQKLLLDTLGVFIPGPGRHMPKIELGDLSTTPHG